MRTLPNRGSIWILLLLGLNCKTTQTKIYPHWLLSVKKFVQSDVHFVPNCSSCCQCRPYKKPVCPCLVHFNHSMDHKMMSINFRLQMQMGCNFVSVDRLYYKPINKRTCILTIKYSTSNCNWLTMQLLCMHGVIHHFFYHVIL